jgi:hypothetical protein
MNQKGIITAFFAATAVAALSLILSLALPTTTFGAANVGDVPAMVGVIWYGAGGLAILGALALVLRMKLRAPRPARLAPAIATGAMSFVSPAVATGAMSVASA